MKKRDFETYQKRFRDFEILPKLSETHVFRGTIRHPQNYKQLSKSSRDSFYQSFSSLSTNHLEVHSRRYMFLRKRRSCEYRHCRCRARIAVALIALNCRSVDISNVQLCLLNKLLQLVPVRV